MAHWTTVTAVATIALVLAELAHARRAYRVCKLVASTGFVGVAVAAGALAHGYGVTMLAGLVLSWAGDAFLLARGSKRAFAAGMGAFAGAHVAYMVGFAQLGPSWPVCGLGLAVLGLPARLVLAGLVPRVPASLRTPVRVYVALLSAMLAVAVGAFAGGARWLVPAGALAFYLSDGFVARERFVRPGPVNRLFGLPLYYAAQVCLAWSTCP
jgi:uncharacterized membrane protein YhhN